MLKLTASLVLFVLGASAVAQDAVQWRVEDGGNGHWYEVVIVGGTGYPPNAISWDEARIGAQLQGGDLATPVTQAENEWLYAYAASFDDAWNGGGAFDGPWLGGYLADSEWPAVWNSRWGLGGML